MRIDSYSFGQVVIDGKRYTSDVIIYKDRVDSSWWRKEGHSLSPEDIEGPLKAAPKVLIIGCGASSCLKIPPQTRKFIQSCSIKLISLPTQQACDEYNNLRLKEDVIACLHLTC
jgi:hypothetical protein